MNDPFLNRFHLVWNRRRQVQVGQALVGAILLAVGGLGITGAADFVWELDNAARTVLVGATVVATLGFAVNSLWRTLARSGRPATAAEIEQAFPELGQSVRTTVQFSLMQREQVEAEGVATSLVTALAAQTHQRALPLTIEDVIPTGPLWIRTACATGIVLLLAAAYSLDWEWRTAIRRAMLHNDVYRNLEVGPGALLVEEGQDAKIDAALIGRTNREVVLFTRAADKPDAAWTERKLERPASGSNSTASRSGNAPSQSSQLVPRAEFVASLYGLTKPIEYRVTAGELSSPTYRIDIRRPPQIDEIKVHLTPPSYTGLPPSDVLDGNLSALQGTVAQFTIQFDKPMKSAELILAPRRKDRNDDEPNEPVVLPLAISGQSGTVELMLSEDRNYSIVAEAEDGTLLAEVKYRIRTREDQPPQVSFEEPRDAVEVHTLTELPMRVHVRDDYGLTTAGVIFQINNEQEIPLIAKEYAIVAAAAAEAQQTGRVSPTTQAALEKVLPLELFELTQKDSVMYYAYAEDNRPGSPQRTETDMQFLDIRPFKREYRIIDPDPMAGMGMGSGLKTLEEMIQRQRFGLNRTMMIEKRAAAGKKPDANSLDSLMKFETELAQNVRETAEGLEARGFDDTDLFRQAETAMLAAVDSLSVGKWENATLQMRDALKFLIEQRERTQAFIMKNPDPARLAALRQFDRLQARKLRRPKTDKEEARELIQRLEQLVMEEEAVVTGLDESQPAAEPPKSDPTSTPSPQVDAEKSEATQTEQK